jgi:hypothetical protein
VDCVVELVGVIVDDDDCFWFSHVDLLYFVFVDGESFVFLGILFDFGNDLSFLSLVISVVVVDGEYFVSPLTVVVVVKVLVNSKANTAVESVSKEDGGSESPAISVVFVDNEGFASPVAIVVVVDDVSFVSPPKFAVVVKILINSKVNDAIESFAQEDDSETNDLVYSHHYPGIESHTLPKETSSQISLITKLFPKKSPYCSCS